MPVIHDGHGHYASVDYFDLYDEHPRDFLDEATYKARIMIARRTVLHVILHLGTGRPLNDAAYLDSGHTEDLANFIDRIDSKRSRRARMVNKPTLHPLAENHRIRSPQDIKKRRRRLFSLDDIPVLLHSEHIHYDYKLLDVLRWHLIHEAISEMVQNGELWFMEGIWQVGVTVMDQHRGCGGRKRRRKVKHDDRSFHGRPNRDREYVAA